MTKEIELTQGFIALVDDKDFERINQHNWCISIQKYHYVKGKKTLRNTPYYRVTGMLKYNNKWINSVMSRFILEVTDPKIKVDHKNGNSLDNRRENLRITTTTQNNRNRKKTIGLSKYKGVYWHKRDKVWQAGIKLENKNIHLGTFRDEIKAALVYNEAAKLYFGEFALLNVIELNT